MGPVIPAALRRPARPSLALALVLGLALVGWLGGCGDASPDVPATPGRGARSASGQPGEPSHLVGGPGADGSSSAVRTGSEAAGEEAPPCAFHPTHRLRGEVRFPEGTPADEVVEVRVEVLPRVAPPSPDESATEWAGFDTTWVLAASVHLDQPGPFDLPFPAEVRNVRVRVEGHYLADAAFLHTGAEPEPLVLSPRLGGCVTVVLDPGGVRRDPASLVGVEVLVSPRTSFEAPRFLDEHLEVTLPALSPQQNARVSLGTEGQGGFLAPARPPLFRIVGDEPLPVVAGERSRVVLPLVDTLVVSGRVLDEDGRPVRGARVADGPFGRQTDQEGRFRLEGLPLGLAALRVDATDFRAIEVPLDVEPEDLRLDGVEVRLDRGLALAGRVRLADGRAVPGISVEVLGEDGQVLTRSTDREGRFELRGLEPGRFALCARARVDERASPPVCRFWHVGGNDPVLAARVESVDAGTRDLELTLTPAPRIVVDVHGPDGQPVEGARLLARRGSPDGRPFFPGPYPVRHVPDRRTEGARGSWDGLDRGPWILWAEHPRYQSSEPVTVELEDGDRSVTLDLRRPASVLGRVEGAQGRGDLLVEVQGPGDPNPRWRARVPVQRDGTFRLVRLEAEELRFQLVDPAGRLPAVAERLVVRAGVEDQLVVLDARSGGSLTCEVVDPEGRPLVGAQVWAHSVLSPSVPAGRTGPDGRVRFDSLVAGPVHVRVRPDHPVDREDPRLERSLDLEPGRDATLRFQLGPPLALPTGSLAGVVRGRPEGDQDALVWVTAFRHGPDRLEGLAVAQVSTDTTFLLEPLPPGRYTLVARRRPSLGALDDDELGWGRLDGVELEEGARLEGLRIDLSPARHVRGRVLGPDGRPQAARVVLRPLTGPAGDLGDLGGLSDLTVLREFSRSDGSVHLFGLLPGRHRLSVHSETGCLGPRTIEVPESSSSPVDLGDLVLSLAAELRVTFDPAVPRHRARVEILDDAGRDLLPDLVHESSHADLLVRGLPPGPQRVRVRIGSTVVLERTVDVSPVETTELRVEAPAPGDAGTSGDDDE